MKYRLTKYETVEYFNTKPGFRLSEMAHFITKEADSRNIRLISKWMRENQ